MTTPGEQIHEVYVDNTGLSEKGQRTLEVLKAALGAAAIGRVATPAEAEAMIVLGGDGTFLHALRRHDFPDIPVTGINTGTLGFFMDTPPQEAAIAGMAGDLAAGNYESKSLPLLEVPAGQAGQPVYAANEVVISRRGSQSFHASLRLGEGEFEHFVGDGFIFATPQGSTSYNLAAGGPIIQENIDAYVVTPSNPHKSHHYFSLAAPTVVCAQTEAVVTVKDVEKRPFKVEVDGHELDEWPASEDAVTVRVAEDKKIQVIRFDGHDYFGHVSAAFRGRRV